MPSRAYVIAYPPRSVAWSGSPRMGRSQPPWTFGRHATPTFGATLFQSVFQPRLPESNCTNVGALPPDAPGWNQRHLPSAPMPDSPQASAYVDMDMTSFTG